MAATGKLGSYIGVASNLFLARRGPCRLQVSSASRSSRLLQQAARKQPAAIRAEDAPPPLLQVQPRDKRPKGLAGSSLPPRKEKTSRRTSSSSNGGSNRGSGGGRGPKGGRSPEDILLGLLTFAGIIGSAATLLGALCGVDPFGHARWDVRDIILGVALITPVLLIDAAILLPEHRSGEKGLLDRLELAAKRKLENLEEEQQRRQQKAGEHLESADALSAPSEAGATVASSQAANTTTRTTVSSSTTSTTDISRSNSKHQTNSTSSGSGGGSDSKIVSDANRGPFGPWGDPLKNGLFLAQGQLTSANPAAAAQLPVALEAAATATECLASEMLWRAVLLQATGGWIADRLFEAGADDALHIGPYTLNTRAAGTCLAAAIVVTASAASAANRVRRAGSGGLAQELRKMAESIRRRRDKRAKKEDQREGSGGGVTGGGAGQEGQHGSGGEVAGPREGAVGGVDGESSGNSSNSTTNSSSTSSGGNSAAGGSNGGNGMRGDQGVPSTSGTGDQQLKEQQHQQQQQQERGLGRWWSRNRAASPVTNNGVKSPDVFVTGSLIPQTLSAMQYGELVMAVRGVSTTAALSLAYAATGNLAASLAGSLLSAAVFSACSRYRLGVFRKEREAVDKQMSSLRELAQRVKSESARADAAADVVSPPNPADGQHTSPDRQAAHCLESESARVGAAAGGPHEPGAAAAGPLEHGAAAATAHTTDASLNTGHEQQAEPGGKELDGEGVHFNPVASSLPLNVADGRARHQQQQQQHGQGGQGGVPSGEQCTWDAAQAGSVSEGGPPVRAVTVNPSAGGFEEGGLADVADTMTAAAAATEAAAAALVGQGRGESGAAAGAAEGAAAGAAEGAAAGQSVKGDAADADSTISLIDALLGELPQKR